MRPTQIHVRAASELGGGAVKLRIHQVPRADKQFRGGGRNLACVPSAKPFAFLNTEFKKLVPAEGNDFIFVYDQDVNSEKFGEEIAGIHAGAKVHTKYADAYLQGYFLSFNTAGGIPAINQAVTSEAVVGALYEVPKDVVASFRASIGGAWEAKDLDVHVPGHGKAKALVAIPPTTSDFTNLPIPEVVYNMWSSTKDANWKAMLAKTLPDFEEKMKALGAKKVVT